MSPVSPVFNTVVIERIGLKTLNLGNNTVIERRSNEPKPVTYCAMFDLVLLWG